MTKLWQKGYEVDKLIEVFTVGDDYLLDRELVSADVLGSMAHAAMLRKIGVLTYEEVQLLRKEFVEVLHLAKDGKFEIRPEDEDIHTRLENHLVEKLGDLGKKIHTGRSRNDQVLVDLRLYAKERLFDLTDAVLACCEVLVDFAEHNRDVPMPGRTHCQLAMPSSVGLWAGAFAESLLDDLACVEAGYDLNDQCPLGSAAAYGVPLNIDRQAVSDALGFARVQNNVLYAANSRGKIEAMILSSLVQVMLTLSKVASDVITFSMPEFAYFTAPREP